MLAGTISDSGIFQGRKGARRRRDLVKIAILTVAEAQLLFNESSDINFQAQTSNYFLMPLTKIVSTYRNGNSV